MCAVRSFPDGPWRKTGHPRAPDAHLSRRRGKKSGEYAHELGLAVALDSGKPHDLPGAHVEGNVFQDTHILIVAEREAAGAEERLPDSPGCGNAREADLSADHEVGDFMLGYPCGLTRRNHARVPHYGDPVGDPLDLLQLVGDEDDGLAVLLEVEQALEQPFRLLRGQH